MDDEDGFPPADHDRELCDCSACENWRRARETHEGGYAMREQEQLTVAEAHRRLRVALGAVSGESILEAAARFVTRAQDIDGCMPAAILVCRAAGFTGVESSYRLSEAALALPRQLELVR
ncbi:MAG TPA: hypothetical protein VJS18_21115 [Paraburkholderia sp.]|nr:hypothetical protein [Paraburkholderia sp.]